MARYKVMVDDDFHYMDVDERYELGTFSTIEEEIVVCKQIEASAIDVTHV